MYISTTVYTVRGRNMNKGKTNKKKKKCSFKLKAFDITILLYILYILHITLHT